MILLDLLKTWVRGKLTLPVGFFAVLVIILLVIIVPNLSAIGSKFGIKSKADLQKEVTEQQATIKDISSANKSLEAEVKKEEQIGDAKLKSISELSDKKDNNEKIITKIIKVKDNSIQTLKKKFAQNPSIKDPEKSKSISEIQINAVWDTYCQFNQDNQCQPQTHS